MLDNPNLILEKTFEIVAYGSDVIGISILLIGIFLIYIYRYEVGLFLKNIFSNDKNDISPFGIGGIMNTNIEDLKKKDFDNKVDNLLDKFKNQSLDEEDSQIIDNIMTQSSKEMIIHPIFRSLKTIKASNEITYHFVNDGGAIQKIEVNPIGDFTVLIEPSNNIGQKESGYLKFELANNNFGDKLYFDMSYDDNSDKRYQQKYFYSLLENKLSSTD